MIVILLILAGITIATLGGENGLFARAKQAKEETQKETATEQINLVISDVYVKSYTEKQEEPTLQDLADGFCNAEGTEYVDIKTRNVSALATVDVTGYTAIYVKLEKYPYEFKIDDTLKIASIDGVEVSSTIGSTNNGDTSSGGTDSSDSTNNSNNSNSGISSEQYEAMQATIENLNQKVLALETSKTQAEQEINELKTELTESNSKINTAQSQIDNMLTTLNVDTRAILFEGTAGTADTTYTIADISSYKYIIIYSGCYSGDDFIKGTPIVENVSKLNFSSTGWYRASGVNGSNFYSIAFYFLSKTQLYIGGVTAKNWKNPIIYRIEGIK